MSFEAVNIGTSPNDQSGDSLRAAGQKINGNFSSLDNAIVAEISNRILALNSEAAIRFNADAALEAAYIAAIAIETANRISAINIETLARIGADELLQIQITNETSARISADNTEAALRSDADNLLQDQISLEVLNRIDGDQTLQVQIDALSNALQFRGAIDCSSNPNYPAGDQGDLYKVSVAGKIGGANGQPVEVGDSIVCSIDDSPSGPEAAVGFNWFIFQANIDGVVIGPTSAIVGNFSTFANANGKIIQDSGLKPSTDGTLSEDSDENIPTEKAVKTYVDNHTPDVVTTYFSKRTIWDNGSLAIVLADAKTGYVEIEANGEIVEVVILATPSSGYSVGSCIIDIYKTPYANFPPTAANTICSSKPSITSGRNYKDTTLGGLTTITVVAGDVIGFNLDSVTNMCNINVAIKIRTT